jgi:hypothetical protein
MPNNASQRRERKKECMPPSDAILPILHVSAEKENLEYGFKFLLKWNRVPGSQI